MAGQGKASVTGSPDALCVLKIRKRSLPDSFQI